MAANEGEILRTKTIFLLLNRLATFTHCNEVKSGFYLAYHLCQLYHVYLYVHFYNQFKCLLFIRSLKPIKRKILRDIIFSASFHFDKSFCMKRTIRISPLIFTLSLTLSYLHRIFICRFISFYKNDICIFSISLIATSL